MAVPEDASGQIYAIATLSGTGLSVSTTVAGPAILLVEMNSNGALIN